MDYKEVESSNILAIGFEKETGTLGVTFTSGDEYLYSDVPESIYDELLVAESVGKAFNQMIRGEYVALKVEDFGDDDDLEELDAKE